MIDRVLAYTGPKIETEPGSRPEGAVLGFAVRAEARWRSRGRRGDGPAAGGGALCRGLYGSRPLSALPSAPGAYDKPSN